MNTFLKVCLAVLFSAVSAFAQSSSGGISVTVPGVQVTGAGVNAGIRVGGSEVIGVGVGVGSPPVPMPAAPKTTLPDMFMALEQNLAAALQGLNAILANPNHTPAQVAAQQQVIETLRSLKQTMGGAIVTTPAPTKPSAG